MTDFSAWGYKAIYPQPGSSDGDKTDYPVPITIPYQSFMRSDFGDIRFALQDGTELSYSLEDYTASSSADFLVQVPSLPASPATTTIIVYAGNSSATTTSDPSKVYLLNDNATGTFTDKWTTITGTGSYGAETGKQAILLNHGSGNCMVRSNVQISVPFKAEFDLLASNRISQIQYCQVVNPTDNGQYYARIDLESGYKEVIGKNSSPIGSASDVFSSANTWVHCVLSVDQNGNHKWVVGGVTAATAVDTIYTSGYIVFAHDWGSGSGAVANVKISQYTAHPPPTGTIGGWTENSLIISTPPIQSILTVNTPQITIGGGIRITAPPIRLTSSINTPTPRAILTSPPITAVSTVIPPIIAFLMEVKAGVTYNPDAINDLKQDGVPCNISFNVTIGDQQYE